MAAKDEELVVFTRADSDEILRHVFNEPSGSPHASMRSYGDAEVLIAYTSGGATARSGSTLGKGTATKRWLSDSGTDRILNTTTEEISFFNLAVDAVAAFKYVILARVGADWICIWEEC